MPKIFEYLTHNTELKERDIYITFNDILPHHVGRNGKIFSNKNIKKIIIIIKKLKQSNISIFIYLHFTGHAIPPLKSNCATLQPMILFSMSFVMSLCHWYYWIISYV